MVEDLVLEVVENSRRLATDSFGSESLTKHTPSAEKDKKIGVVKLILAYHCYRNLLNFVLRIFYDISSFENEARERGQTTRMCLYRKKSNISICSGQIN